MSQSTTTSAPEARQLKLEFAGIQMAAPLTPAEREAEDQLFREAISSGDYSELPPPRPPSVAVWKDEEGNQYIVVPDEKGNPTPQPFTPGPVLDLRKDDPLKGGFITASQIATALSAQKPLPDIAGATQRHLRKNWVPDGGGGGGGGGASTGGTAADEQKRSGPRNRDKLMTAAQRGVLGIGQNVVGNMLGTAVAKGPGALINNIVAPGGAGNLLSGLGQNVVCMGIGNLMSLGSSALFQQAWGITDSSSMGEQLAHKYAQEAVGLLQGELQDAAMDALFAPEPPPLMGPPDPNAPASPEGPKDWKETYFGLSAPTGFPAGRITDPLDAAHPGAKVVSSAGTVLVAGMLAARITDRHLCPKAEPGPVPHVGGPVAQGNPTVFVEKLPLARDGHITVCEGCGLPGTLKPAQATVHIGPKSTPPPVIVKKPAALPPGAASGAAGAAKKPPAKPPAKPPTDDAPAANPDERAAPDAKAEQEPAATEAPATEAPAQPAEDLSTPEGRMRAMQQKVRDLAADPNLSSVEIAAQTAEYAQQIGAGPNEFFQVMARGGDGLDGINPSAHGPFSTGRDLSNRQNHGWGTQYGDPDPNNNQVHHTLYYTQLAFNHGSFLATAGNAWHEMFDGGSSFADFRAGIWGRDRGVEMANGMLDLQGLANRMRQDWPQHAPPPPLFPSLILTVSKNPGEII